MTGPPARAGRRTGSRILSTIPGGKYGLTSDTSMASPHVTGVISRRLRKEIGSPSRPAELLFRVTTEIRGPPGDERMEP